MSYSVSGDHDRLRRMSASADAIIIGTPARRRARATAAIVASVLTAPMTIARLAGAPTRAGIASSQ